MNTISGHKATITVNGGAISVGSWVLTGDLPRRDPTAEANLDRARAYLADLPVVVLPARENGKEGRV